MIRGFRLDRGGTPPHLPDKEAPASPDNGYLFPISLTQELPSHGACTAFPKEIMRMLSQTQRQAD